MNVECYKQCTVTLGLRKRIRLDDLILEIFNPLRVNSRLKDSVSFKSLYFRSRNITVDSKMYFSE